MKSLYDLLMNIEVSTHPDFSHKDFVNRAILIGVTAEIVLSKEIFKKNEDLKPFLDDIYNLALLDYLFKSRTLLLSRVIREIESTNSDDAFKLIKSIDSFLSSRNNDQLVQNKTESTTTKNNKRKRNLDTLDNWRKVISGDNG